MDGGARESWVGVLSVLVSGGLFRSYSFQTERDCHGPAVYGGAAVTEEVPKHEPVPVIYLNEESLLKMFTVKLMRRGSIHLYYAERVIINKPDHDDRSIWMKWVETGENGLSTIFEDTVYIDGEQYEFGVIEQGGKTVEVVRTRDNEEGKGNRARRA